MGLHSSPLPALGKTEIHFTVRRITNSPVFRAETLIRWENCNGRKEKKELFMSLFIFHILTKLNFDLRGVQERTSRQHTVRNLSEILMNFSGWGSTIESAAVFQH